MMRRRQRRSGATAMEAALVLPLVFLLTLGMMVAGLGVFRNHEMAWLSREAARFASTHGADYAKDNKAKIQSGELPAVDTAYLRDKIIRAQAAGLNASALSVTVTLKTASGEYDWDNVAATFARNPTSINTTTSTAYQNVVKVQVSYTWTPEWFFTGPIVLSSTSEMPMSY